MDKNVQNSIVCNDKNKIKNSNNSNVLDRKMNKQIRFFSYLLLVSNKNG